MARPKTKAELQHLAQANFDSLISITDSLSSAQRKTIVFENRTPKDILIHLHDWHNLMLDWYKLGMKDQQPNIPATGYSWKSTPELNEKLYQESKNMKWNKVVSDLKQSHKQVTKLIDSHTDKELFTKKKYNWTGSTSLGAYLISSTSSHYDWAIKEIKKVLKQ